MWLYESFSLWHFRSRNFPDALGFSHHSYCTFPIELLFLHIQDDRLADLDNTAKYASHRVVLTKMHLEQILKRQELELFVQALMPHQKAVRSLFFLSFCICGVIQRRHVLPLTLPYERQFFSLILHFPIKNFKFTQSNAHGILFILFRWQGMATAFWTRRWWSTTSSPLAASTRTFASLRWGPSSVWSRRRQRRYVYSYCCHYCGANRIRRLLNVLFGIFFFKWLALGG